jgi:hypothetical protein
MNFISFFKRFMFKKNMSKADRFARLGLGLFLMIGAWQQANWIALAISLFAIFESLTSWCFFYQLIGKNTCPKK